MRRRQTGFSLVELMVSLMVVTGVAVIVGGLAMSAHRDQALVEGWTEDLRGARAVLDRVERDVRAASAVEVTGDGMRVVLGEETHTYARRDGKLTCDEGAGPFVLARNVASFGVAQDTGAYSIDLHLGSRTGVPSARGRLRTVVRPRATGGGR